jgi:hypothetical protein
MTEKDTVKDEIKRQKKSEINRRYREKLKQQKQKVEILDEETISMMSDADSYVSSVREPKRRPKLAHNEDNNDLSLDVLNKLIDSRIKKQQQTQPQYTQPQYTQPQQPYPYPYPPIPQQPSTSFISGDILKVIGMSLAPIAMAYLKPTTTLSNTQQQPSQTQNANFGGISSI